MSPLVLAVVVFVFLASALISMASLTSSSSSSSPRRKLRMAAEHLGQFAAATTTSHNDSDTAKIANRGVVEVQRRKLQGDNVGGRTRTKREIKRSAYKYEKLKQAVKKVEAIKAPSTLQPDSWCKPHNKKGSAIFAAAMDVTYTKSDVGAFAGTLRKYGYTGDIVLAIMPDSRPGFLQAVRDFNCITYTIPMNDCTGENINKRCRFEAGQDTYSVNMMRFYLYQWWGQIYDEESMILVSDFRDVFFQSNPFNYKNHTWGPPDYQLVVFQESFPNKMIYRCNFNAEWIRTCYGAEALQRVGENMVSCSGVTIGTRDALMVYAYLMTQQLDPNIRYKDYTGTAPKPTDNSKCSYNGVDQGFHNYLLYSGQLAKLMDVKYFPQGEGPVNTVGAFSGQAALVKMTLVEWKILRGEPPNQVFVNWNGDPSPTVHQYDRYMSSLFNMEYDKHLFALKDSKN